MSLNAQNAKDGKSALTFQSTSQMENSPLKQDNKILIKDKHLMMKSISKYDTKFIII